MKNKILALALATTLASSTFAQQPLVIGGQSGPTLRAGTEIPLKTLTELTTEGKHLRVGQRFDIETSDAITLNGQTVIPVGTHGVGEIISVRNKGMWGKSGNIEARLLYIRVGDRQMRLSGTFNDKGVTGTAGVVGAIVLIPIAGFLVTGTSARIPAGSNIKGFLDEDVPVAFAEGTKTDGLQATAEPATVAATSPSSNAPIGGALVAASATPHP
jgi:hypothetical protein